MITVDNLSKSFGARVLFQEVSLNFNPGERYGLTGPNGSGKSTFLRILQNDLEASSGSFVLPKRVGVLKQDQFRYDQFRIIDTVLIGNKTLWETLQEREKLYAKEQLTDQMSLRLAELEGIFAEEGGYTCENQAAKLLKGIGISEEKHYSLMETLPVDLRFRVLLAQALFGGPDALLLDEPTNYLDLESIQWLEKNLKDYKGSLIVISHDRQFLNSVCTHIADIDYQTVTVYPGNYDQMIINKAQARESLEASNKNKTKKIAKLEEFVAKFGAGQRASQTRSRSKEIERIESSEIVELKKSNIQRPYIKFGLKESSGERVLLAKNLCKSYPQALDASTLKVLENFSLEVTKGEKIGVIGNNGLGKTTLLRILVGDLQPDRGELIDGHKVSKGYFPQNYKQEITPNLTALKWLENSTQDKEIDLLRSYLGRMLFSGEEALKKTEKLSGGESARLILTKLMLQENNLLILDEPTNHLDLEAVSALSEALSKYKGTAIFVSHDRDLITNSATRIIAFGQEKIEDYPGSYQEYLFSKNKKEAKDLNKKKNAKKSKNK